MSHEGSRWPVIAQPTAGIGADYFTRSNNGPFIDTGLDVRSESPKGRVYLSLDTVREMAENLGLFEGLIPEAAMAELVEVEVEKRIVADHQKDEEIRGSIATLAAHLGLHPADLAGGGMGADVDVPAHADGAVEPDEPAVEELPAEPEQPAEPKPAAAKRGRKPRVAAVEDADESRSDDLPSANSRVSNPFRV